MKLEYTAKKEDAGKMLKYLLRERFLLSASLLRRSKVSGELLLNGEPVFVTRTVSEGDKLELVLPGESADFPAQSAPLDIIYEDELILAVNKPEGMLTHPSHSRYTGTLANFALGHILSSGGENCHAVNRLDRDTSGVVLFAKNSYAKALFCAAEMEKSYIAAVFSCPKESEGTVSLPIKRLREGEMRRVTAPDGVPAVTHYRVIGRFEGGSLVRLHLETGRTHQIRVHMLAIGCPLLGDGLYYTGASRELSAQLGIKTQLLHAESLRIVHPLTGEDLRFDAPPGTRFDAVCGNESDSFP